MGGLVGPEDVVDREAFIDELVVRLSDRHSVILAGPRRTGKSTVAYETLRRLRNAGAYTAAVDLATTASVRDLAERLTAACLANVAPGARAALAMWRGLGRLLRVPEVRAKMHELELSVALRPDAELRPEVLLEEALDLPERLAARDGRRFVLLFDEFQMARSIGGRDLLARMRGLLQLQRQTAVLFLGSQAGVMAQLFGAGNQPFFRFATMLDLPPIPDDAWHAYIDARLAERGVAVEGPAVDVLLVQTGGHPYDTMQVAYEGYLLARPSQRLSPALAAAAGAEAAQRLRPVFEAEVDALGATAGIVLKRIAAGQPLYEGMTSSAVVERTIRALRRQGVVRRLGRGRYEFAEPMLAEYLRGQAHGGIRG